MFGAEGLLKLQLFILPRVKLGHQRYLNSRTLRQEELMDLIHTTQSKLLLQLSYFYFDVAFYFPQHTHLRLDAHLKDDHEAGGPVVGEESREHLCKVFLHLFTFFCVEHTVLKDQFGVCFILQLTFDYVHDLEHLEEVVPFVGMVGG